MLHFTKVNIAEPSYPEPLFKDGKCTVKIDGEEFKMTMNEIFALYKEGKEPEFPALRGSLSAEDFRDLLAQHNPGC